MEETMIRAVLAGLAAAATLSLATYAFALDSYVFPTDVLPQSNVAVEAGYNFLHDSRTDNYTGGSFHYEEYAHSLDLNAQAGLGYGVQIGFDESAITSDRITNTGYTTAPSTKYIFGRSGFENPTFTVKASPADMLKLVKTLGLAAQYAYTPNHWGSSHVSNGYDTHAVSAYGSLATGPFRSYIGWAGQFNGAATYRAGNTQTISLGTEYNLNKELALTLDADFDRVSSSTFTTSYDIAGAMLGAQYALAKNIFFIPYFGAHYQAHHNWDGMTREDTSVETAGAAIKAIF
jgi:hypothetical protein